MIIIQSELFQEGSVNETEIKRNCYNTIALNKFIWVK